MPRTINSVETQVELTPTKFAINSDMKVLTPIKGDPPVNLSRGRRRDPVLTQIYQQIIADQGQWFHVNISFTNKKQLNSFRGSLIHRARKDAKKLSTASLFNDNTKIFDLWIRLN
jgi:hypothetical protein